MPIAYLVRFLYSHRKRGGGGGRFSQCQKSDNGEQKTENNSERIEAIKM